MSNYMFEDWCDNCDCLTTWHACDNKRSYRYMCSQCNYVADGMPSIRLSDAVAKLKELRAWCETELKKHDAERVSIMKQRDPRMMEDFRDVNGQYWQCHHTIDKIDELLEEK